MIIPVIVNGQRMRIPSEYKFVAPRSQKFVKLKFRLSQDWNGLTIFAQFVQNNNPYNSYLNKDNIVDLPVEITEGKCTMMLYGTGDDGIIATSNFFEFQITKDIFIANASSTEISQSLYDQLVQKVNSVTGMDEEAIAANVEATTERILQEYLADGSLAQMTLGDGSVTRAKLATDVESVLKTAESAMQPSVYDPQNLKTDVFAYAKARGDTVQDNLDKFEGTTNQYINDIKNEIEDTYQVSETQTYTSLGDAVRGVLSSSKAYTESYTKGALGEYDAFYIKIVDALPTVGEERTFYLIPNESGTKYDKYWWIVNEDGNYGWDNFGASSTVVVDALPETGDADTDYILKLGNGCMYYKWIDGKWQVVAGSMASVVDALPETGNEFTDYYVKNESGSYVHYRWMPVGDTYDFVPVGSDSYTKEEIDEKMKTVTSLTNSVGKLEQDVETNATNINALNQSVTKVQQDVSNIDTEGRYYTATKTQEGDEYIFTLYETEKGETNPVSSFTLPSGGGGSGSVTTNMDVQKITSSPLILTPNDSAIITISYSSTDAYGSDVDGTYVWKTGGNVIMSGNLIQGNNTFDLSNFIAIGTTKFTLTITDEGGSTAVLSYTIQVVDVRIESNFSDRYTNAIGRSVSFTYTPYGSVSKTVHFKLDGVEDTFVTSASGTLQSYSIEPQEHGSHLLEVWITAVVNNIEVETNHIFKDIIWYDETATTPVIGCSYRYDFYGKVAARQYDTTPIVYNVYDPSTNFPTVQRYIDDVLVGTDTISENQNIWNYKSDDVGEHTLKIVVGSTTVVIVMNISELGIDVSPITGNLEIDFNPTGITNSSGDRIWSNGTYSMSVSDNFDWANGGYCTDDNGDSYFLVKAGTNVTFDYMMFGGGLNGNPSVLGAEMKIIFMTENVQDANAVWLSNVETTTTVVDGVSSTTNVGIQMGVHEGWLKTNNASDTNVEGENGADDVAATNTYLYMPYSEEDIIEMDINIDTLNRDDETAKAFVMSYEDGVPSKAYVYDSGDRFYQYTPQPITIGSAYCDVRIYRMKIYSTSLSTENIMRNFIADARDSTTMLNRYDRNSIYYNRETNTYTPYSGEGILDPERLAPIIPNVKVLMLDTDHFTTSKKTFVKSSLRCIHAAGGKVYTGDPYYDNWYFENGWHSGQGTTSDNYGNAGRNVDFLFNCDGVHKPSDKVSAEAGYVSQVTLGYGTENRYTEQVTDWKGDTGKVGLTRTSVPNNFWNLKVNIASSENVNNALLQKRYNDFLPYISPAKQRDERVKNDMEFVPAILFLRENNPDISTHNEFLDTNWHFYALGNLGDSKKTDYTRAYDPEDINEFTIEISDNTKNNATFQTGVYLDENGQRQIEKFTVTESEDDGDIIYTPVSVDKPQSFIYPVTLAEWENENNMRHWCIYNEGFDGDHSFEPRYACCGDYRDGKLVNDTTGNGKAQVKINNDVWRAFYRWVITSTDEEFVNELDQWCVRSAVEFFYAFTTMYTMMDNRAKNTFWHFAKTGTYRQVTKPVKELLHVYCELVDGEYVTTSDIAITEGKTYYTQYAFDLWDYDNDRVLSL